MTETLEFLTPQIIYQDEDILILFKPSTWFVHPPENPRHRRGLKRRTCVQWLMDVENIKANPIHRLDVPTEGLIAFAKNKLSATKLNAQFKEQTVQKNYHAVVRGWLKPEQGVVDLPLELDSTGKLVPCITHYKSIAVIEHQQCIQPKFPTTRYSLLEIRPQSGRWHQIRRHMNRKSHPVIGDREHGDSRHNRYFRETLAIDGLCLRAAELSFRHPTTDRQMSWQSPLTKKWQTVFALFGTQPTQVFEQ